MATITIPALVEGGKASAAPPLGPSLAPTGLNIGEIIGEINEKTKAFAGMQVPIKVIVDKAAKKFTIEIGTPPTSALVKKELGLKEPVKEEAGVKGKKNIGNLTVEQVAKIIGMKKEVSLAKDSRGAACEIAGTCLTMGVTINGKNPREFIKEIKAGKHDSKLA